MQTGSTPILTLNICITILSTKYYDRLVVLCFRVTVFKFGTCKFTHCITSYPNMPITYKNQSNYIVFDLQLQFTCHRNVSDISEMKSTPYCTCRGCSCLHRRHYTELISYGITIKLGFSFLWWECPSRWHKIFVWIKKSQLIIFEPGIILVTKCANYDIIRQIHLARNTGICFFFCSFDWIVEFIYMKRHASDL